jgi:formylglycine-generating enzyme required for sulfatase activity
MTNCGASVENCCTSLLVTGGSFYRTYDNDGDSVGLGHSFLSPDGGPTAAADPATVSTFREDKYDVTVGRFRQFVGAWRSGWMPTAGSGKHGHLNGGQGLAATAGGYEPGWASSDDVNVAPTDANLACDPASTWSASAGTQESLPINCVNWYESYAFCIWDGGFLPSEAEQGYAAGGGDQQREYPWGSSDPGIINQYAIYQGHYECTSASCPGAARVIAPVGTATLGAGRWGQLDLAGNVWQWNLDWTLPYAPCTDCADLSPAMFRTSRGGYFGGDSYYLVAPWRGGGPPAFRGPGLGFRCARSP